MNSVFEKFKEFELSKEQATAIKGGVQVTCQTADGSGIVLSARNLREIYSLIDQHNNGNSNPIVGCDVPQQ
ncbi:MAG: hypothetical protein NW226_12830 [Microscillaceae bacterium]|nr:hypothetical protein [Microscillaceae bacterium]